MENPPSPAEKSSPSGNRDSEQPCGSGTTARKQSISNVELYCPCQRMSSRPSSEGSDENFCSNQSSAKFHFYGHGANTTTTTRHASPKKQSSSSSATSPSPSKNVLCTVCVNAYLKEAKERRARTIQDHARWKETCKQALDTSPPLAELQHELQRLQNESESLRVHNNQLAWQTTKLACQNEERQVKLAQQQGDLHDTGRQELPLPAEHQRYWLSRIQSSLLDAESGALNFGIVQTRQMVRRLRFQWAVAAFAMHRLDVAPDHKNQRMTHRMKHARGIGKIAGLPLPHAGPELYGVLPPIELQSALRLVASLTSLVATCLGIRLPHPIRLTPHGTMGDLAAQSTQASSFLFTPDNQQDGGGVTTTTSHVSSPNNNPASASSFLSASSSTVFPPTTQQGQQSISSLLPPPSLDTSAVQKRIYHTSCAVLAEKEEDPDPPSQMLLSSSSSSVTSSHITSGTTNTTTYSLSVAAMQQSDGDEFAIALQLLQNDIVALCIRAGTPVDRLMPAEAVLLNLNILQEFCFEQTQQIS